MCMRPRSILLPRRLRPGLCLGARGLICRLASVLALSWSLPGLIHQVGVGEVAKRASEPLQVVGRHRCCRTLCDSGQLATNVLAAGQAKARGVRVNGCKDVFWYIAD